MSIRFPPARWIVLVVAIAATVLAGCARDVDGVAVAGDTRPHDVWQLANDLVTRSPLSPDGLSKMLGIGLTPTGKSGYKGGPVELGPQLTVSSVSLLDIPAVTVIRMAVETPECVSLADVQAHYPDVKKRVSIIQGGTITQQWSTHYSWGGLSFAVRHPGDCLQSVDVSYPKRQR
jgi:hypothetical protein